jgi:hypothetical protein
MIHIAYNNSGKNDSISTSADSYVWVATEFLDEECVVRRQKIGYWYKVLDCCAVISCQIL